MKYFLIIFYLLFSSATHAETPNKVLFHINDPAKLQMLVNNVTNLRKAVGPEVPMEIIFNGSAVTRLANFDKSNRSLVELIELGIPVGACSNAILNHHVDRTLLLEGVNIIEEGGVVRIFKLQTQGYAYIKI